MNRKRKILKKVFVDLEENEKILKNMGKARGKNFSAYARELLLNGEINIIDFENIREIKFEINKIGNNINQIVKLGHEKREITRSDLEIIIKLQKELVEKIHEVINVKKIGRASCRERVLRLV